MESERKILALHFTYSTDITHFIIELRQLLADAEILDLKLQKQSILKILPTKFLDTFRLKIVNSQNIDDVFINLRSFLSQFKRVVKYGSVITLRHIDYRATGPTDHELWTIMPEVIKDGISPTYNPVNDGNKIKGSVVCYGDQITLLNNGTGQKLHSHKRTENSNYRKSPVTSQQEDASVASVFSVISVISVVIDPSVILVLS
ncbi:18811_t:CDS:2, partial [Racocetra fulgida]